MIDAKFIERINSAENLWELLHASADIYADNVAFENFGNSLSFADLGRLSDNFAAYLQGELKVKKGDRVALMCPNLLAFPVASMAIMKCGAVQVSVNPLYTPSELLHQLNDSQAGTLVVYSGSTASFAAIANSTAIQDIVVINVGDCGQTALPSPSVDEALGDHRLFSDGLRIGAGLDFTPVDITGEDLVLLQYTGGTTGPSKGAVLTHRNLLANLEQTFDRIGDTFEMGSEIMVCALPLYHIFGLMANFVSYVSSGGKNILITNPRDMDGFVATIKTAGFTRINGVNTLFAGLMTHPEFGDVDFSRLKMALSGGMATLETTSNRWQKFTGLPLLEAYGLSETSPVLTLPLPSQKVFSGKIGFAVKDTDIKIIDDNDIEVPDGERGELVCKGAQVTQGYYQRPDATAEAFTPDGYFRTGDIAIKDGNGYYAIVDRKKDMVLVSGFNVYPNDVEQVASRCAGVVECACLGVPDEKTGEAVKLFVVREAGSDVTPDEIIAHCAKHLTNYKIPHQIEFIAEVPKSAVGKMLRRELRK